MSNGNPEQERLRRLRERQLADRDPNVKQREFQQMSARRERKLDKSYSLGRMWADIPHTWKGFFYGVAIGTGLLIILPFFISASWVVPCASISIVLFGVFGLLLGRAVDAREEIKDLTR
jgi:hypothetical protein